MFNNDYLLINMHVNIFLYLYQINDSFDFYQLKFQVFKLQHVI